MPQEWKISEHTISVIAKAICQSVSDISDIKFYGRGEGSLCYMISKILKKKCDNKSKLLYARLWEKNVHNLQDIVRNTFKEKINGSISCKPEESATSAELVNSEDNLVKSNKEDKDNPFKSNEEDEDNAVILNEEDEDNAVILNEEDEDNAVILNEEDADGQSSNISIEIIETPKRSGITKKNVLLFSENNSDNDVENNSDYDSDTFESPSSESDECDSNVLSPVKSPLIKQKYCVDHGEIEVSTRALKHDDSSINKENVRAEICKFMLHTLKFPCPLAFFGGIRKNLDSYVTYARCRYNSHPISFRFALVKLDEGICTFFISSTKCDEIKHEGPTIFCTLRGSARKIVKEQLQYIPPRTMQRKIAKQTNPELAQEGHMQDLRLLSTYQKAKSEHNCRNDRVLNSSDLSDLFQQWIEDSRYKDPYIRYVGLPLYAIMFSQEQLDVIDINDSVAHFDATGSVVRKPYNIYCKRIMYYAIVVKKGESIIPIAEMITSEHDIPSISILLKRYRQFAEVNRRKWPLFKVVVVDWSWALINSLMNEWNRCDIIEYLERVYSSLDKGTPIEETLLIVHTCCAHFMKRVSSYIQKKFPKSIGIKTFVLECVAVMLMSTQLLLLDEIFEEIITILLTPKEEKSQLSIIRLNQLRTKSSVFNETDFEEDGEEEEESGNQDFEYENVLINEKNEGRIFSASPFFKRYNYKYVHLKERIQRSDDITNKYYNPEIAEYITYKLMPFVPMWSSILLSQIVLNVARLSNAYVESYFNVVKNEILQGQVNLKIGRFINKMKNYKCSLIAEAMIKVPIKSRQKKIKRLYPESPLNPFVREMWQRRKKAKYSLMEGRQLSQIAKKCEPTFHTPVCDVGEEHRQILTQQSSSSMHNRALNNGLFPDIEYYMQDTECNITVGRYFADRSMAILSDKEFYLFSEQFRTLNPGRWIDGTIIDCFVVSQINHWKNIVYVPTDHTSFILGDYCDRKPHENWLMYNITEKVHGKMLLPYLYRSHWRLLVIDIDERTIIVLDPYKSGKDDKRAEELFKRFLEACPKTSLNTLQNINFKRKKMFNNRPFQKASDGTNCGVYILHYIKCIGEGQDFGTSLEPTIVRKEIAETLLNTSSDMKERYLFCFNIKKRDLVMCNLCRRWAHPHCIGKTGKQRSIEEWADPNVTYICNLCKLSIRNWMTNKE